MADVVLLNFMVLHLGNNARGQNNYYLKKKNPQYKIYVILPYNLCYPVSIQCHWADNSNQKPCFLVSNTITWHATYN